MNGIITIVFAAIAGLLLSLTPLPYLPMIAFKKIREMMCAEKTGGFNLVNYRHSSGVYHEQETEDLHRRI